MLYYGDGGDRSMKRVPWRLFSDGCLSASCSRKTCSRSRGLGCIQSEQLSATRQHIPQGFAQLEPLAWGILGLDMVKLYWGDIGITGYIMGLFWDYRGYIGNGMQTTIMGLYRVP